ncbi:MAG: hypothetical protein COW84_08925 [Gammaproteobacteria bacterium CG22_combo_CG10-13_8_21_14_all_40_8]|nr:MAG: hypothetical protein COW84_08925 [Gammaproteobacteria bacterium CG22_combo_CG10-13_8_21_14_all_40_8]
MKPIDTSIIRTRKTEETVLLWLSAITALSLLPFAFFRLYKAEWAIGVFDSSIIFGMCSLWLYVYKTGKTKGASLVISFIMLAGMLLTIVLKGTHQIVWSYPATVSIYYLNKYKVAATANFIAIVILALITYSKIDMIAFTSTMVTLLATNIFALIFANRTNDQRKQLLQQATKDSLTKVGNRRAFDYEISKLVQTQTRHPSPISIISIDLDHFKDINDTYGHVKGDEVLIDFTQILKMRLRGTDNLYRVGGEEFIIIPVHADLETTYTLAEQLRILIEVSQLTPNQSVTISIGVAEYKAGETANEWVNRADKALYQAKNSGRNRVCVAK